MIYLHAAWSPARGEHDPSLFLWGEDSDASGGRPRDGKLEEGQPFPGGVPPREVRLHLGKVADGLLYECAEEGSMELLLPTWRGAPATARATRAHPPRGTRLHPWKVPGLHIPPEDSLPFLTRLPREAPASTSYGGSLRYWSEAAALGLGLLARQRIIPSIADTYLGGLRRRLAVWQPIWSDPEDRDALELLIAAMPGICRAQARSGRRPTGGHRLADPGPLLRDFVATALDAALRRVLAEEGFPDGGRGHAARSIGGPLGAWLRGLGWIDGSMEGEARNLEEFSREVRRWNDLLVEPPPGSYRTALRLTPPPADEEGAETGPWRLEFFLQDRCEPENLVPASRVWEESGIELVWGERVYERPQDHLLEDLGRAAGIFPPLERALATAMPTECSLTLSEAHTFLSQAGPLLDESGFGVLLPTWWRSEEAQPQLRLHLRPAASPGRAMATTGTTVAGAAGATGAGDAAGATADADGDPGQVPEPIDPAPFGATAGAGLGVDALIHYDWGIALGDTVLTPAEFHRLAANQQPLVRHRGRWFEVREDLTSSLAQILKENGNRPGLTVGEALYWSMGGLAPQLGMRSPEITAEGWVGDVLERLRGDVSPAPILMGEEFHGQLRPYQERGVGWLDFMRLCGLGACLADDMGLGKTVQLIALLLHDRKLMPVRPGPTLVLCPMSVVGNWQREIERFAPGLRVMVHHGFRRLRDHTFPAEAAASDVVVTTYALAHRDRHQLAQVTWERLVLDEAQNIKNPSTLQTRAVRGLRARTRVGLTGTPLENRLSELWSILDVLNPGYLGNRAEFRRTFALPIERYRDRSRQLTLRRLVQPFLLRRLKTDPHVIRDLPEKLEMRVFCNLTREQATLYQAVVSEMMAVIEQSEGIARRGIILNTLTKLKQVCNHPLHFRPDGGEVEGRSGKVARLTEMLEEILAEGDRALVFTQFTEMGTILQNHLAEKLRTEISFLHGGTPRAARDRLVEEFQEGEGPAVFLLSLRAGGTGLNLTAARHVFHFDRWWNPAVEDQATDRAFRIGQTRNVQVHKFVCVGTLEERIDQMILEKRDLASVIVGAGEQWLTEMDTKQLREVLTLSLDAVSED